MEVPHFPSIQSLLKSLKEANNFLISLLFLICIYFTACSDSSFREFDLFKTTSSFDFHAIEIFEDIIYATGGDVWNKSILATSNDGINWSVDSLTNKSIFDLYSNNKMLYGVGNDGYILSGAPDLVLTRTKFWGLLKAFSESPDGFIAAGGKDFNKGWLYKVNNDLQVDTAHYFENEILDVVCNNSGTCIACGYGIILISKDSGLSWLRSSENGDYYNSIAVNSNGDFFIVGYNGNIIRSTNNGKSWKKFKNGHGLPSNNKPFRAIEFQDDLGIIAGENGLIWISYDLGENWEDISIDTDLDLYDFALFNSNIICVSESGQILNVKI